MREVKVFKMELQTIEGCRKSVKVFDKLALFHAFAQEADGEGQSNPVAIVECANGQVETVYAHMIAFVEGPEVDAPASFTEGVTMRDYFAAKAMAGFCANPAHAMLDGPDQFGDSAKEAYAVADCMLAERAP